jgi:hypothetical protein
MISGNFNVDLMDIPYTFTLHYRYVEVVPQNVVVLRGEGSVIEDFDVKDVHFGVIEPGK